MGNLFSSEPMVLVPPLFDYPPLAARTRSPSSFCSYSIYHGVFCWYQRDGLFLFFYLNEKRLLSKKMMNEGGNQSALKYYGEMDWKKIELDRRGSA